MTVAALEHDIRDLADVVDNSDEADSVCAADRSEQKRLWVHVADAADGGSAVDLVDNALEFGPKWRVFDVVDLALETKIFIV